MCCASATQISDCTMIWTVHFSLTLFGAGGKQRVGGAGRMAGGSGTGQSHPAAGTAWLCGDKMPLLTGKSGYLGKTFLVTLSAWGRSLWRQNHRSSTIICCLYTIFLVQASQYTTRWALPALSIPCCSFTFFLSWWAHIVHPTDALQHKWEPTLGLLNIHGSVVCRFLCLWLVGTGKLGMEPILFLWRSF